MRVDNAFVRIARATITVSRENGLAASAKTWVLKSV
jgi:hypothetical protein